MIISSKILFILSFVVMEATKSLSFDMMNSLNYFPADKEDTYRKRDTKGQADRQYLIPKKIRKLSIPKDYSKEDPPPTLKDGPVTVRGSINVRNIFKVDEKVQVIGLETSLRLFWKDSRLKPLFSNQRKYQDNIGQQYVILPIDYTKNIWLPDVFIDLAIEMRKPFIRREAASLRLYNDTSLRFSARMNYDVACPMDVQYFPVDSQTCIVKYESFGLSNSDLILEWSKDESDNQENHNMTLHDYEYIVHKKTYTTGKYYDIEYSGLELHIHLLRHPGHYILHAYIPSSLFVLLGWLALFIPYSSVPGRVGMGMTAILTLMAMYWGARLNMPVVSYVSLLDIWMTVCLLFVTICMIETVVVIYLADEGQVQLAMLLETRARLVIPVTFTLFSIVYWLFIRNAFQGRVRELQH